MTASPIKGDTQVERLQALLPEVFRPVQQDGGLYIQLQISSDVTVGLPLDSVQEVTLTDSLEVTPIPNMPESVLGLLNTKGYVFWLVDLAMLLGFDVPLGATQRYEMIVVRSMTAAPSSLSYMQDVGNPESFVGFVVQHVRGSSRVAEADLCAIDAASATSATEYLLPYVDAYMPGQHTLGQQNPIPILNIDRILNYLLGQVDVDGVSMSR